jgi:hypothetical protein
MKALLAFAAAFVFAGSIASAQVVKPDFAEECEEGTSCDFRAEAYVAVPLECMEEEVLQLGCIERSFDEPLETQLIVVTASNDQGDRQAAQVCIFGDALDEIQISNVNFSHLIWQDPGDGTQDPLGNYTSGSAVVQDVLIEAFALNFYSTTTNPNTGPYTPHGNLLSGPGTLNLFLNGDPDVFASLNGNPSTDYVDGWGWVTVRIGGVFFVDEDQQRGTYRGTGSFDVDYVF